MVYCAGKLIFLLKVIRPIDHTFYGFIGVINALRMLGENEKSL